MFCEYLCCVNHLIGSFWDGAALDRYIKQADIAN